MSNYKKPNCIVLNVETTEFMDYSIQKQEDQRGNQLNMDIEKLGSDYVIDTGTSGDEGGSRHSKGFDSWDDEL